MNASTDSALPSVISALSEGVLRALNTLDPKEIERRLSGDGQFRSRWLANLALATDSYKASHYLQYPPGTTGQFAYIESRGGPHSRILFFGLQMILKDYLSQRLTHAMVDEAAEVWRAHGEPFNEAGFRYIVDACGGYFPIEIKAPPEGTAMPTGVPLVTVESTDPQAFWAVSFIETLLMQLWYPITVATVSWHARELILRFLEATSDDPQGQIGFKLHDFGFRGVSSVESAARGAAAHLVSFMGTDTMAGVLAAREFYDEAMAGYSIPAAEHSTITAWGRDGEADAYRNMLKQFAKPGSVVAVVSDSYDLFDAVERLWGGELREQVVASGATVVIRPDSGVPEEVVLQTAIRLDRSYGSTLNSKGYKVLKHVRIIQGDGINAQSIRQILANLKFNGFSADNVAFGMGGALLQQLNRDTFRFAMKTSAVRIGQQWRHVYKDPATDPGKRSKAGRISAWRAGASGDIVSGPVAEQTWSDTGIEYARNGRYSEVLEPVWRNGHLLRDENFTKIRARALQVRPDLPPHWTVI